MTLEAYQDQGNNPSTAAKPDQPGTASNGPGQTDASARSKYFVKVPLTLLNHPTIGKNEVLLYIGMARLAHFRSGAANASLDNIARSSRLGRRCVLRSIKVLQREGFIQRPGKTVS